MYIATPRVGHAEDAVAVQPVKREMEQLMIQLAAIKLPRSVGLA